MQVTARIVAIVVIVSLGRNLMILRNADPHDTRSTMSYGLVVEVSHEDFGDCQKSDRLRGEA